MAIRRGVTSGLKPTYRLLIAAVATIDPRSSLTTSPFWWGRRFFPAWRGEHNNVQPLRCVGHSLILCQKGQTSAHSEFEICGVVGRQTLRPRHRQNLAPCPSRRLLIDRYRQLRDQVQPRRNIARGDPATLSAWRRTLLNSRCHNPGTTAPSSRTRSNRASVSGDASSSKHQVKAMDEVDDDATHGRPASRSSFQERPPRVVPLRSAFSFSKASLTRTRPRTGPSVTGLDGIQNGDRLRAQVSQLARKTPTHLGGRSCLPGRLRGRNSWL